MTALVLGADSAIGLTLIRELGRHGVRVEAVGRDPRAIGGASRHAAAIHVRPAGPIAAWLPPLIARTQARALLAVSEGDLVALAALPPRIDGCVIATPRAEPLRIVLDKRETLRRAALLGIEGPKSWQPSGEAPPALDFPVVLKWADPTAILPLLESRSIEFRKTEYALNGEALALALGRYNAIGQWPLVQSYAPGVGLGQMLYMDQGRATLRFQHQRLHEWPPEGGVSTLCRALPLDEHRAQMARSEALLAAIGWEGAAMVEYRYDPATRRYALMEINGRFWGSLPLASACGAEFGWETYRRAVLGETTPSPAPRSGVVARYLLPETRRLARLWFGRGAIADPFFTPAPLRDTLSYVARSFDPTVRDYVFRWDDLGPVIQDVKNGLRKLAKLQ
ncbi:MAG: carboxylate--amine ligase [Sphingomonas sp.]|nr:carboxylate--amine ligase [Sphingomonas sp.]